MKNETLKTNASKEDWNTFFYKNCIRCSKNLKCQYRSKLDAATTTNELELSVVEGVGFKINESGKTFEIKQCALFDDFGI